MNREIKFRAWLEGTHGRITFSEPTMYYDPVISGGYAWDVEGYEMYGEMENVSVMQFTGMTDKNNVDIYEGDIIESSEDGSTDFSDGGRAEVVFEFGQWYLYHDIHNALYDIWNNYDLEVIGNIYENPELLEGEDG